MEGFMLTRWITIQGDESVASITQSAAEWLDLPEHEDVQVHLETKEVTSGVTMNLETAPTRQETSFVPLVAPFALSTGARVADAPFATALNPLSRFLRWRLTRSGIGVWSATFQIWVSASRYG